MLEAMVQGWEREQRVRFLKADTMRRCRRLVQRLVEFSGAIGVLADEATLNSKASLAEDVLTAYPELRTA